MTLPDSSEIRTLRDLACRLATDAGEKIRATRPAHAVVAATKSSSVDPVTEMDQAIETFLREAIQAARPHDAILGEEGDDIAGTSGLTWVIDPIDGTVNYLYGVGYFAVSVAVVAGSADPTQWTALAGCVHCVNDGRTWVASAGQGATRDGKRLQPDHDPAPLESSLVATGFGYAASRRASQARVLMELLPQIRDIRRLGSAAIDLCLLADGSVDIYFERGLNPWDMAAGALIAQEAGMDVMGLRGQRASALMTVGGRGEALESLVALLERHDADAPDGA
ncbi:MAG: inositol monophosphatase [Cellulomonadaceae bacterium]|jgi:myo-inositol-1(or 4)-monophosphatase|nr:inositol monophosphatase [Cellulomonadaceae bacterium]